MEKVIKLENVDLYNSLYGLETLHPLVSIVDLTKATKSVNHIQMNYGLYALFLKETKSCDIKYGRQYYDYQEGTIVCFGPGQTASVETFEDEVSPPVYGIVFHPDLIRGTSLGKEIKKIYFLFLRSERSIAPVRSGKGNSDGLPEENQHRIGTCHRQTQQSINCYEY